MPRREEEEEEEEEERKPRQQQQPHRVKMKNSNSEIFNFNCHRSESRDTAVHCVGNVRTLDDTIRSEVSLNGNNNNYLKSKYRSNLECRSPTHSITAPSATHREDLDYVNLNCNLKTHNNLNLSKHLILNKFFRSTEKNFAAYENLCTGCGYGVFEARGRLCNFCQFVLNGGYLTNSSSGDDQRRPGGGNIYENICEKCSAIYSGEECDFCLQKTEGVGAAEGEGNDKSDVVVTITTTNNNNNNDNENKSPITKLKLSKKRLFNGLIGSLKRVKTIASSASNSSSSERLKTSPTTSTSSARNRLEIIHNVDGYENVFCTNESFDLERICELKRLKSTSSSDHHIYGRLRNDHLTPSTKQTASCDSITKNTLSQSANQLVLSASGSGGHTNSTDVLVNSSVASRSVVFTNSKSDPNLLKINNNCSSLDVRMKGALSSLKLSRSKSKSNDNTCRRHSTRLPNNRPKQSLYLQDSVCQWMTSLRSEIHSYHSFGAPDDTAICNPKSIPPRNSYFHCLTTTTTTTVSNRFPANRPINGESRVVLTSTIANSIDSGNSSRANKSGVTLFTLINNPLGAASSICIDDDYDDDKCSIVTLRRSPSFEKHSPPYDEKKSSSTSTSSLADCLAQQMVNEFKRHLMAKQQQQMHHHKSPHNTLHRSKRQAIYLKLDEIPHQIPSDVNRTRQEHLAALELEGDTVYRSDAGELRKRLLLSDDVEVHNGLATLGGNSRYAVVHQSTSSSNNNKRCGIYEKDSEFVADILSAFDTFLRRDSSTIADGEGSGSGRVELAVCVNDTTAVSDNNSDCTNNRDAALVISGNAINFNDRAIVHHPVDPDRSSDLNRMNSEQTTSVVSVDRCELVRATLFAEQSLNIEHLIYNLVLSRGLNKIVVSYDNHLKVFIQQRSVNGRRKCYLQFSQEDFSQLVEKFRRFVEYINLSGSSSAVKVKRITSKPTIDQAIEKVRINEKEKLSDSLPLVVRSDRTIEKDHLTDLPLETIDQPPSDPQLLSVDRTIEKVRINKKDPFVVDLAVSSSHEPIADQQQSSEKTSISSSKIHHDQSVQSLLPSMTVPTLITTKTTTTTTNTDATSSSSPSSLLLANKDEEDIYQPIWKFKTVGEVQERYHTDADYYDIVTTSDNDNARALIVRESSDVEDHGEWETDDEFMFTTKLDRGRAAKPGDNHCAADSESSDSGGDSLSLNSSTVKSSISNSGSTITGYASSNSTMTIASMSSLTHHTLRNICIFYSLIELKMRAILYDYDRNQCSSYFPSRMSSSSQLPVLVATGRGGDSRKVFQLAPTPPIQRRPRCNTATTNFPRSESVSQSHQIHSLSDSVQAWKYMLLDVNYVEDEEDMIVSESEILRAQEIKEEDTKPQVNILQRFKSISSGNLLDIPAEEDKKSITERMRNKLQRGVFKLNVRSPKGEKKSRGIFRRAEATSLYLEDGMKPKYPIFGAQLEQLELNHTSHPNVPRFVVDCIEYIERKDCIRMDGLYRASGNKVSIDELKQKLSESYIYDPKLLVTDDIHTLTSLLKMFFRELAAPLIPQEIYQRLGRNLMDQSAIDGMKNSFREMRNPNRATLKFLIKHLTNVAHYSSENRMPASNLAIVWGPCILSANQIEYDIARMNTLAKILIENFDRIFGDNERLVS